MDDVKKAAQVRWWSRLKLLREDEESGERVYQCNECNWDPECPVCQGEGEFKLFLCEGCGEWVPWAQGAADDCPNYCDECFGNQIEGVPV